MADPTSRQHRDAAPGRARRCGLAAAFAVIATGGVLVALAIDQHARHDSAVAGQDAQRRRIDQRAAADARPDRSRTPGSRIPGSAGPVSAISGPGATLVVAALDLRAPIVASGADHGSMVIPSDIHTVGWYDGINTPTATADVIAAHTAPWPGQPGVAILAGHVDRAGQGPGALYYLDRLRVGDPLEVIGTNGVTTTWHVSQPPITRSKDALPASLFENTGPPRLAIVTCGGPFDAATGHYLDNVIVWATAGAPGSSARPPDARRQGQDGGAATSPTASTT